MALEFTKKKEEELDELPEKEEEEISLEEKTRKLELENAELRGFQKASETKTPLPAAMSEHEQTKARVAVDMANLDDERFLAVYKMDKNSARATLAERDNVLSQAENKRALAEAEAKVEMATKFGADFYRYKDKIEEAVADLSEEARKDPKRLARAMERMYLSFQKEGFATKSTDSQRKKIVNDFEPPTPGAPKDKSNVIEEIPEAYKPFSKIFGIRDEKERQQLMKEIKEGEFVPMNMGGGVWFKHPDRGFEKIETPA